MTAFYALLLIYFEMILQFVGKVAKIPILIKLLVHSEMCEHEAKLRNSIDCSPLIFLFDLPIYWTSLISTLESEFTGSKNGSFILIFLSIWFNLTRHFITFLVKLKSQPYCPIYMSQSLMISKHRSCVYAFQFLVGIQPISSFRYSMSQGNLDYMQSLAVSYLGKYDDIELQSSLTEYNKIYDLRDYRSDWLRVFGCFFVFVALIEYINYHAIYSQWTIYRIMHRQLPDQYVALFQITQPQLYSGMYTNNQFTAQKDGYEIKLALQINDKDELLTISLIKQNPYILYELKINQKYIDQQSDMNNIIDSPHQLFTQIKHNLDQIVVDPKGSIRVEVKIGANKRKVFVINTIQQQCDIKLLSHQTNRYYNQLQSFKKDAATKMEKLQSQNQSLKLSVDNLKQKLQNQIAMHKTTKEMFNKMEKQQRQKFQKLYLQISQIQQYSLDPHYSQNSHFPSFISSNFGPTTVIKHIADNGWHKIMILGKKINNIMSFTIKAVTLTSSHLFIGVGTKKMIGQQTYQHKDYFNIYFYTGDQNIYGSGVKNNGNNVVNNDVLKLKMDLNANRGVWILNDKQIVQAAIPEHIRNEELLLVLYLWFKNDAIEFYR